MELSFSVKTEPVEIRRVLAHTEPVRRRFFNRVGGAVRLTARRSLRKARQKKVNELTAIELTTFRQRQQDYQQGKRTTKPRRPELISEPGMPPKLHQKPSPLKTALVYAVDADAQDVVIGPERTKSSLQKLEQSRPFMAPAYEAIKPRLPSYLAQVAK